MSDKGNHRFQCKSKGGHLENSYSKQVPNFDLPTVIFCDLSLPRMEELIGGQLGRHIIILHLRENVSPKTVHT